jgi:hypothetical protein
MNCNANTMIIYPVTKIFFEGYLEITYASMLHFISVYMTPNVPIITWYSKPEDAFCAILATILFMFCCHFPHIVWRLLLLDDGNLSRKRGI